MSSQPDPTPAARSEPGCSHEIPWPTIFFWMACLAINSISQPTGRVLGTPYQHQSILRGSPILCAFDAIHMLVSWVIYVGVSSTPPTTWSIRIAATRILLHRVVDDQGKPDLQAIHNFNMQSRVRWIAFLVGALPQVIKLYTSSGVAWSQAFGAMYLASWLLFEILVIAARLDDLAFQYIGTLSEFPNEELFREIWAFAAMLLHAVIYSLLIMEHVSDDSGFGPVLGPLFMFSMFSLPLWMPCFIDPDNHPDRISYARFLLGVLFQFINPWGPLVFGKPLILGDPDMRILDIMFYMTIAGGVVLAVFGHRWAKGLVDMVRVLTIFMHPLFFYGSMYDPAGTYQPSWFQWLG
ncbi:hypothetical protein BDW59DRAFT_142985 [Aspergillus cavernicola]|uniref:Uncharacterized protein n=1 Tax=Aspergillus cavernicola TaxID=176166 RepID=A0ABR4ILV7_9EURO